jgi:two-component system chemotaxis response regulator CheB
VSRDGSRLVVVCEDSHTYAEALRRALEHDGEIRVVGVFSTAEDAIAAIPALQPHLVTMDIELPGISGLHAVEEIMGSHPLPILVLSAHAGADSENAAAALAAGALDAVHKDALDLLRPESSSAAALRKRVKLLSGIRVIRHPKARIGAFERSPSSAREAPVIGICASTGGPHALVTILNALPASFPVPILVVQHIAPGFTEGLVNWLEGTVALPVGLAEDGAPLRAGVWVAPDDAHLLLRPSGRLALDRSNGASVHRPSADVLLRSIAESAGTRAVAVVLTGMGRDGGEGVAAITEAGGLTIAQDEPTSAVYGMPKTALERGAERILPIHEIAGHLAHLRHRPLGR